jgi:uncharacterized damage-inducible protein DinB
VTDDYSPRAALEARTASQAGTEREVLTETLQNLRAVVAWKLSGIDDETAKRSVVDSATTLLGLVHHLAWVEAWWFQDVFAGADVDYPFDWDADPDAEFRMGGNDTVESILDVYEQNVVRANEIIAAAELDATVEANDREYSLRWILAHMIDETARHAGHMDIIREQLDGATGYLPPM